MKDRFIDIVIFLSMDWKSCGRYSIGNFGDAPFIRKLSKLPGIRILCVNQPFTPVETTLGKRSKAKNWMKGDRLERLDDTLYLYTPFAFVHEMLAIYSPLLQKMNAAVLSRQIRRRLSTLGLVSPVRLSWIYHPLQHGYLGAAGEGLKIYKCWDLYRARCHSEKLARAIARSEEKIISECDAILTPCMNLYKELSIVKGNTFFTPAGVDCNEPGRESRSVREETDKLRRPIIGFAGIISKRVDMSLIRFLAESHPQWSVVMVGKIHADRELLGSTDYRVCQGLRNVHFLGFKEFDVLPLYIENFDVCLLPHSDIDVMRYSHPYKTLQYLAAGKPVVSTDFPDARYYREVIRVARGHREFAAMVEESLRDDRGADVAKRIAFAKGNTWEKRAEETYDIILNLIHAKGAGYGEKAVCGTRGGKRFSSSASRV
ncbi:MAG: glycosyltransferase [Deltaproteobacteria bacterium]|nr:glycosyltransferase [Deltaproteobacteria bacterium]